MSKDYANHDVISNPWGNVYARGLDGFEYRISMENLHVRLSDGNKLEVILIGVLYSVDLNKPFKIIRDSRQYLTDMLWNQLRFMLFMQYRQFGGKYAY